MVIPSSRGHVQRCGGTGRCATRVTWRLGNERSEQLLACDAHLHLVKALLEVHGAQVLVQPIRADGGPHVALAR